MTDVTSDADTAQGQVIESQLDWITAGWDEGHGADRAEAWALAYQRQEARDGARAMPFALMGYQGTTVGRVRFGRRSDAALLQLSGQLAEDRADDVLGSAHRVSRVDLAVTVRLHQKNPFLGEETYAQACNWHEVHSASALPSIHADGDGGCTAYVGRRASDRYLRVYNKEAECKARDDKKEAAHYESCWRYELQTGGSVAFSSLRLACAAADRSTFLQSQLYAYCIEHGITPAFIPTHDAPLVPGFRRRSDAETRMAWLRRAVGPAILNLLEVKDRADILEALGLGGGPEVPPRPPGLP